MDQLATVHLGTIGETQHGKTTLAAALTTVLAKRFGGRASTFDQIDQAPRETVDGVTYRASRVAYATSSRRYAHVDCPSPTDCAKNLIVSAPRPDSALLVVSALDGRSPRIEEQVRLARETGIVSVVIFLNKCELVDDVEMLDLVEMDLRSLLSDHGFPGDETPVVRGSALGALNGVTEWEDKIVELAGMLDSYLPDPQRPQDRPFLMPVDDVLPSSDGHLMVTGTVERGVLRTGGGVSVVGPGSMSETSCTSIEKSATTVDLCQAGDTCAVELRAVHHEPLRRGTVLAAPGTLTLHTRFEAVVYLLNQDEGGRLTPIDDGHYAGFRLRMAETTGSIALTDGARTAVPGDHARVTVTLLDPVPLEQGQRVTVHEDGRTVGIGVVGRILG
ncbi:GTP-binding protein [Streptomyces sp. NPDC059258]|uniref:GTP-binding protein n=1 Tax=unclassified Streptomyces TaxID=2593676 RepID=UPI003690F416